MHPKLVVFDMDGTISDSKEGIFFSYCHVADVLGKPQPTIEELNESLGGSLHKNIQKLYDLDDSQVLDAVYIYRDEYSMRGESLVKPFEGIVECIDRIREKGMIVSIATLKVQEFAVKLMVDWKIDDRFDSICGADYEGILTKADLIRSCMEHADASKEETVMIGDSMDDLRSARECGVRFIGAAYGFSLSPDRCITEGIPYAMSPSDIPDIIETM